MSFAILPQQSPIDLGYALPLEIEMAADSVVLDWSTPGNGVPRETGHGPEIAFEDSASSMAVRIPGRGNPESFQLAAFHFHHPSEHQVNGKGWPLEVHVVHKATEPDPWNPGANRTVFAVLGIFIEGGAGDKEVNKFFESITRKMGKLQKGKPGRQAAAGKYDPRVLLPFSATTPLSSVAYWRYEGSLTTNTNSLNGGYVSWTILEDVKQVDSATLDAWLALQHHAKAPQELDRRYVLLNRAH